ncbi:2'-5' RNA ligase family protein [Candidatus Parcubacteria bacterium]|nr:2'-5' RNA ligase family protein [Candidatus Parcubacteria bacterium]
MNKKMIFNINSEFDLIKKPAWLDDFRAKYDKPYRYHVTFKTNAYLSDTNFENLKNELSDIAKRYQKIKVIFNKLFISITSKGGCIMIKADRNNKLSKLQKEISEKFSKYGKHTRIEYKKFEKNFNPHITIARRLSPELLNNAKNELLKDLACEALIEEIILTVVKKDSFDEWSNPQNKSFYKLGVNAQK